jgi:hypothetical protein
LPIFSSLCIEIPNNRGRRCRSVWSPIQCSFQKEVKLPLPTFLPIALLNHYESLSMRHKSLHHHDEPNLVTSISPKILFLITSLPYLATTISFHNSFSQDKNFPFHIDRRLIFTNRRSRTPNPLPSLVDK